MERSGSAAWQGGVKDGKGSISTQSGALKECAYGFNTRFEEGPGTNPEELIAAAHAGCFTMALSGMLGEANFIADSLHTKAAVTIEKLEGEWTITLVHLDVVAHVPGIDQIRFADIAAQAKANCPVSKLLNAQITLHAVLE